MKIIERGRKSSRNPNPERMKASQEGVAVKTVGGVVSLKAVPSLEDEDNSHQLSSDVNMRISNALKWPLPSMVLVFKAGITGWRKGSSLRTIE